MRSKLLFGSRWATLCFWLVKKLSRQMMSWPWATRRSQRWEPRKPAPPVTRIRFSEVDVVMLEGSGFGVQENLGREPRHAADFLRPYGARHCVACLPTACAVGYRLAPLRGCRLLKHTLHH